MEAFSLLDKLASHKLWKHFHRYFRLGSIRSGSAGRLYNQSTGLIFGRSGVEVTDDGGVSIINRGEIFGYLNYGIHASDIGGAVNNVLISNSGLIEGPTAGVRVSGCIGDEY